jgi:hypothetical protein
MSLSTGLAVLLGLALGVWTDAHMQAHRYAYQVTALQVAQCTKADKP